MNKSDLFNEEIKNEFLDEYQEGTRTTYYYTFKSIAYYEYKLNKDVFKFDEDELNSMFHDINFINLDRVERYKSIIENYINWTIRMGHRASNINPLIVFTKEMLKGYVGYKKLFISENELMDIENAVVNKQDILPLRLAFEGITGEELVEQRYLEPKHIEGNTIHIHDQNDYVRSIEVSDRCIYMINETLKEKDYYFQNGTSRARRNKALLKETKYILKSINHKNDIDVIDVFVIYKRLRGISEWFNYPLLSYKNVRKSGEIKMMADYCKEHRAMSDEYLQVIADKYGIENRDVGEYSILPRSDMKKYINKKNIEVLYGIQVTNWT